MYLCIYIYNMYFTTCSWVILGSFGLLQIWESHSCCYVASSHCTQTDNGWTPTVQVLRKMMQIRLAPDGSLDAVQTESPRFPFARLCILVLFCIILYSSQPPLSWNWLKSSTARFHWFLLVYVPVCGGVRAWLLSGPHGARCCLWDGHGRLREGWPGTDPGFAEIPTVQGWKAWRCHPNGWANEGQMQRDRHNHLDQAVWPWPCPNSGIMENEHGSWGDQRITVYLDVWVVSLWSCISFASKRPPNHSEFMTFIR